MIKKTLFIFAMAVSVNLIAADVFAQEAICGQACHEQPTCQELGYIYTQAQCPNGISCPFSNSAKWCKKYTCEDGRYSSYNKGGCTQVTYQGLTCFDCAPYN